MSRVLVLTNSQDVHADYVTTRMEERGVLFTRFDSDQYTTNQSCSIEISGGRAPQLSISGNETADIDLAEMQGVWFRKVILSECDFGSVKDFRAFMERETESFFSNLYGSLQDPVWINRPERNRFADNKLVQLQRAAQLGMEVPKTLASNDPSAVRAFMSAAPNQRIIYKTLNRPFVSESESKVRSVFTSVMPSITEEVANSIRLTPCLFQEYVEKAYELRVTMVGEQAFSARVYSQEHEATKVDWRREQHCVQLRYESETLDTTLHRQCIELLRGFGLLFGAIDIMVRPDGSHVFVELNPNGQWLWLEKVLGLPIADALIDLLTAEKQPPW